MMMMMMMMRSICAVCLCSLMTLCCLLGAAHAGSSSSSASSSSSLYHFSLYHSIDSSPFSPRSAVQFTFSHLSRTGAVSFPPLSLSHHNNHDNDDDLNDDLNEHDKHNEHDGSVSNELLDALRASASSNGLYRVRAVQVDEDGRERSVTASVPTCWLFASSFRDRILFHVDIYGHLIAMQYRTVVPTCDTTMLDTSPKHGRFRTKGKISLGRSGPKPVSTQARGAAGAGGGGAGGGGGVVGPDGKRQAPKEEKTFLQKYWVHIAVVVGMMVFQGAMAPPPPPSGGGGGRGGGGGGGGGR